jgi:hypothetical protein
MRMIFLICIVAVCLNAIAQQPCTTDTLRASISQSDTLSSDTVLCFDYCTTGNVGHVWQMQPYAIGTVTITASPLAMYQVWITNDCNALVIDTCVQLFEPIPLVVAFDFAFGPNSQVWLFGPVGSIGYINFVASIGAPSLPPTLSLLDTLCPTSLQAPVSNCEAIRYIDIANQSHCSVRDPKELPCGIYWEWCGSVDRGRKIIIFGTR